MTKKLKTKKQAQADENLIEKAGEGMKNALKVFYGEYHDWDCNYSRISIKYYEALEEAYEQLDFATERSDKKYVSNGGEIDWTTTTHAVHYKDE
jgi:hypothetical protein|tara:strand:+ start:2789 stop:3070 length:282 start_codon:yes stop_codon:yes gene_type:complete